jgi:hypothetical protein
MKLCINCKHFKEINLCVHPNNGINPVYGTPKAIFATRNRMSSTTTNCGADGQWFEEKPVESKLKRKGFWSCLWGNNE